MKTLTNHMPGPRGINLVAGGTLWLDPGQSAEIDVKDVSGPLPDLGSAAKADPDDAALIAAIEAENSELKAQVADLTKKLEAVEKKAPAKA